MSFPNPVTVGTAVVGLIVAALFFGLLLSYPVMLLWNSCLVPAVTTVREIGWFQAWGLMFLFSVLFKTSVSTKNE